MPRAHRRTDGAHCAHARTHAHAYTYTRTTSSFVMSYTNRTLRIVMSHTNRTLLITHLHAIPSHPTTSLHLPLHPNPHRPPISIKRNINYIIKQKSSYSVIRWKTTSKPTVRRRQGALKASGRQSSPQQATKGSRLLQ